MINKFKDSLKNSVSFMKPRIVLCLLLVMAFLFSAFLFAGQTNTFIIKYNGTNTTVRTLSADIGTALVNANISEECYKVESALRTGNKTEVSLLKTFPVVITAGDNTKTVSACENDTVEKVLKSAGYKIDKYDMIEPALTSLVNADTYIDYVNIDYVTGSYEQAIPHSIETVYSNKMDKGEKKT
ncbi:MAG: DUF348 domain-containing protein, partial [Clostridia bacterium]|nr:DUF348 domain-containing protein [Clostridia bacterium]